MIGFCMLCSLLEIITIHLGVHFSRSTLLLSFYFCNFRNTVFNQKFSIHTVSSTQTDTDTDKDRDRDRDRDTETDTDTDPDLEKDTQKLHKHGFYPNSLTQKIHKL